VQFNSPPIASFDSLDKSDQSVAGSLTWTSAPLGTSITAKPRSLLPLPRLDALAMVLLNCSLDFQTIGLIQQRLFPRYYRFWLRQGKPKPLLLTRSTRLRKRKPEESPLQRLGPSTCPIIWARLPDAILFIFFLIFIYCPLFNHLDCFLGSCRVWDG